MNDLGTEQPTQGPERALNLNDSRMEAMSDAFQSIDKGHGDPRDLAIAIRNGAAFYTEEAAVVTGPQQPAVAREADRFTRARDGGYYGQLWFCADVVRHSYEEAMESAKKTPSPETEKTVQGFLQRAQNWQDVQAMVREAGPRALTVTTPPSAPTA